MSSFRDRLAELAIKQLQEMERNPAYKAMRRQMEAEERNPGLRIAREQLQNEELNPALKVVRRQIEEEQRNPGLRIIRERLEQEQSNPFLRIARDRINEQQRFDSLYHVSSSSLRDFDRHSVTERLREWERKLPDWLQNPKSQAFIAFDSVIGHLSEARRMAERLATTSHIELRNPASLRDWDRFTTLSREFSNTFRSLPPEISNTFLVRANEQLELIRESAEKRDVVRLEEEFDSFLDYIFSWVKSLGSKILTRDAALAILVSVVIAALQQAQSYKWRLDDQEQADLRGQQLNQKLDTVLQALIEQQNRPQLTVGKPYSIERTTPMFAHPGSKQRRVGYAYAGQPVLAIATTGRWILVECTDPFSLERRVGWIRKKYAKLQTRDTRSAIPEEKITLQLAMDLYERGELSLGKAAEIAGLSKRDFIDVLGQHHVPVINYPADDLREEIGV